jgi:Tfp pilus assembly protein PilN
MSKESFADCLVRWQQLRDGLAAQAGELAFLAEDRAALEALLAEVQTLNARQEALKAELQQATQALDAKVAAAAALESRLRASLKGKYGARSEQLEAFGIKVRQSPARRPPPQP